MALLPHRIVLDTNILVRGLINRWCDSGRILHACEQRRVVALLSKELISEYRFILNDADLAARYPQLRADRVGTAIERLMYVGEVLRAVRTRFVYSRDRKDEKLITLAIAGRATHLITTDRDLLDLPQGSDNAAKRFRQRLPTLEVLRPEQFVERYGRMLDIQRPPPTNR
jgi:putative PIN family toxin of toxin-antitoxin system